MTDFKIGMRVKITNDYYHELYGKNNVYEIIDIIKNTLINSVIVLKLKLVYSEGKKHEFHVNVFDIDCMPITQTEPFDDKEYEDMLV